MFVLNKNKDGRCSSLYMWVQIIGPREIFAGKAKPVHVDNIDGGGAGEQRKCYWEFKFLPSLDGTYIFSVKLLEWNPHVPRPVQCPITTYNSSIVESFAVQQSFLGFKMYQLEAMCCEICSRLHGHCKGRATPIPAYPLSRLDIGKKNKHHR